MTTNLKFDIFVPLPRPRERILAIWTLGDPPEGHILIFFVPISEARMNKLGLFLVGILPRRRGDVLPSGLELQLSDLGLALLADA